MSLVGLLATTTLITLANLTPSVCAAAQQEHHQQQQQQQQRIKIPLDHDHFLLVLLLNRQDHPGFKAMELENGGPRESSNGYALGRGINSEEEDEEPEEEEEAAGQLGEIEGRGAGVGPVRDKRIGHSMSIVNSVDVLRERVLLELARRKAMEDERQISENRRLLNSLGKRAGAGPYRPPPLPLQQQRRSNNLGQLERRLLLLQ